MALSVMRFKGESVELQEALGEAKQSLHRAKHNKKTAEQYAQIVKHKYEQCLSDLKTSHSAQLSDLKAAQLEQAEEARKQLVEASDAVEKELKLQLKAFEVKHAALRDGHSATRPWTLLSRTSCTWLLRRRSCFRTWTRCFRRSCSSWPIRRRSRGVRRWTWRRRACAPIWS